jgi:outer membrane phospholipase A
MKQFICAVIFILLTGAVTSASTIKPVIIPVETKVEQGSDLFFTLYFHNRNGVDEKIKINQKIECFFRTENQITSVDAKSIEEVNDEEIVLKKDQFKIINYRLDIPYSFKGDARVSLPDYPNLSFRISIIEKQNGKDRLSYQTIDSMLHLYQPYLENLTSYKPIYFLIGTNPEDSKFQLSFKYRFIDPNAEVSEHLPWLRGMHFGYTQTSFWNLESDSIPFEDTSYKPEFFYLSPNISKHSYKRFRVFLQTGLQHESNGRGDDESRSTNFLYIKPIILFFSNESPYGFSVSPKIWTYIKNEDETNKDLYKYRGYFELQTAFGRSDDFLIESSLYWGSKGGSVSVDFFYPLHRYFKNLDIYFQAQYTNALAESLLHYEERNESLRLGFAIVR